MKKVASYSKSGGIASFMKVNWLDVTEEMINVDRKNDRKIRKELLR